MGKKAVSKLFYCTSIALTFVLAGITIAGAFAGHIPPEHSTLMPFIGLALSGLLLINLAAAIYWGIRRRFWIIIPLIAIAANWQYLSRIFQPPFTAGEKEANTLKIATYNVDSFGNEQSGYSCKELAAYMKEHRVDIICFQEFAGNRYFTPRQYTERICRLAVCRHSASSRQYTYLAGSSVQQISGEGQQTDHLPRFKELQYVV